MMDSLVSYIISARRRCAVLRVLSKNDLTVSEISEITYIRYGYVMVKLQELMDKGLVTHNGASRSKIYSITPLGEEVMQAVRDYYGSQMKVHYGVK